MSLWLWTFWTYSFLGYLLERGYAIATHADRQARKCFLLLPMCPVYGLGALAVLALPAIIERQLLVSGPVGRSGGHSGGVCRTSFSMTVCWGCGSGTTPRSGGICGAGSACPSPWPGACWLAAGLPVIQAAIAPALAAVPPTATYAALLVFTADTVVSLQLLRRAGDPAVLSLGNLRAA